MTKKVLWLGFDGCRVENLAMDCPYLMNSVLPHTSYSFDTMNEIAISSPSWISLITGQSVKKHRITDNKKSLRGYLSKLKKKTIRDALSQSVHRDTGMPPHVFYCQWDRFPQFFHPEVVTERVDDEQPLFDLLDPSAPVTPDFVFYYDSRIDNVGHDHGFSPTVTAYRKVFKMTDKIIKTTVATLQKRMTRYPSEDWLVVFLTDHGGACMCDVTRSLTDNPKSIIPKMGSRKLRHWKRKIKTLKRMFNPPGQGEHGISSLPSHRRCFQIYLPIKNLIRKGKMGRGDREEGIDREDEVDRHRRDSSRDEVLPRGEILPAPTYRAPSQISLKWLSL